MHQFPRCHGSCWTKNWACWLTELAVECLSANTSAVEQTETSGHLVKTVSTNDWTYFHFFRWCTRKMSRLPPFRGGYESLLSRGFRFMCVGRPKSKSWPFPLSLDSTMVKRRDHGSERRPRRPLFRGCGWRTNTIALTLSFHWHSLISCFLTN